MAASTHKSGCRFSCEKMYQKYTHEHYLKYKKTYDRYSKEWREKNKNGWKKIRDRAQDKLYFGGMKQKIFKRDNYECQICGNESGDRLGIHHFNGNKKDNSYWNLLTLCTGCHKLTHLGFF